MLLTEKEQFDFYTDTELSINLRVYISAAQLFFRV